MNHNFDFLHKYLNSYTPVGHEQEGQKIWIDNIRPHVDKIITDNYGTAIAIINPEAEYKVVLEAHVDEISWYVNHITQDGYLYVIRNGGSDHIVAPSMRATIHTDDGTRLPAVFGWPAIHVRRGKQDDIKPELHNIVLDAGFSSAKEVGKAGICPGCVVTLDQTFTIINKTYWTGRALDNRAGGYAIAQVAALLSKHKEVLPFGLYIVNSVQEEIGLKGAGMAARRIQPNVALVTDVTHDTQSPLYNKVKQGNLACGKGPVIGHAPSIHNKLRRLVTRIAQEQKIDIQHQANSSGTGTDTDAFAYSNTGVPSALISLPLKYMHTTVEMVDSDDVSKLINLLYHSVLGLKEEPDFRYFSF